MDIKRDGNGSLLSVTVRRPSNFHAHFRRGAIMQAVGPEIMRHMKYVLAMPNNGPVTTLSEMAQYYIDLLEIAGREGFEQLSGIIMTLYHTEKTTPRVIELMARSPFDCGVKHYPPHPGATTGSGHGIPLDDARSHEMLCAMEQWGIPLLGHFESVVDKHGHPLPHEEREKHFVENVLWRLRDKYPDLYICFEHVSTKAAVEFVRADRSGKTVATVTPQHLSFTRADLERLSWRNHLKCMPIVKGEEDRDAVIRFVTLEDPRAIMGDDTAPHPRHTKEEKSFDECASGCWVPHALAFYVRVFEEAGELENLENFTSLNGPRWWRLKPPAENDLVTVRRDTEHDIPDPVLIDSFELVDTVVPLGWSANPDRLKLGYAIV